MFADFEKYIKTQTAVLTDDEISMIARAATVTNVRKKQLLLQAGDVCRYKIFILEGFLRTYGVDADGEEHVMQFSPALTWTTEGESYANCIPSNYNIEAIEDSRLMLWTKDTFTGLMSNIPSLKQYSENLVAQNLHTSRNRLYKAISATAEEKYEDFVKTYPGILLRVPLRMVASYLGVSLKTLSRIRQAQLQR
ncbi:Crp/Fnr family transcriptional regulator [Mucilaginibacter sp. UR6-1]|uniref:Crp/Fnr family transcriptional regulator n=1 Tax=Mucilaginibacter sp. UR6-1 TaxID=1435643 RepID=UPI001E4D2153|nr:Crp/Fnr family transcriptional regulator [Mucilaginibacter sp. UR6-1]MCC8409293.1 Crp/Fnr family transcriptional regulator [Mucilaginibacter sp. UR6-1]